MTPAQILSILQARWITVCLLCALVVSVGVLFVTQLPKRYTTDASVLLDVESTDPVLGAGIQALAINSYMATQAEVLRSERVLSSAVRSLGKDREPETLQRWQEATEGQGELLPWIVAGVRKNFEVRPSRESNVITVSYTSADAHDAAAMTNAIVDAYIRTTIELRTEPAKLYNEFFAARTRELRAALEQAQAKLSEHQRKTQVVATSESLDIETSRLSELSTRLVVAQSAAAESRDRRRLSQSNAESMQDVQENPLLRRLYGTVVDKQSELASLQAQFSGRYPPINELRRDIASLQAQIKVETAKILRGIALEDRANQNKAAQLQAAVNAQRKKVLELKSQRDLAEVLRRDLENAERAYRAAYERASQSSLESKATQTNVSILQHAAVPAVPSSPQVRKLLAVALLLGILLGGSAAILSEVRCRRLRIDDDVALLLGLPLVGVLPNPAGARPGSGDLRLREAGLLS